jgi:hypothetical protein
MSQLLQNELVALVHVSWTLQLEIWAHSEQVSGDPSLR